MLYWDQIVYLDHNHNLICSADDNFLRGEGVLDVLTFTFNVKKMERYNPIAARVIYETTLSDAFRFASERYKAVWSYLQPSWKPDTSVLDSVPVVELKLYNLLPVPNEGTPFDDILEFKRRRVDELRALRIALDDLIQGVRQASEPIRGLDKATMTVSGCLEDLRRVANEGLATRLLNTLKVTVNLPALAGGAVGGAVLASEVFQLPIGLGAAAGAMVAAISAELKPGNRRKALPIETLAYQYAVDAERELTR